MSLGPLIIQSDRTVLLETDHQDANEARHELAIFAELERAPEHIHTYRITKLGLWNARAAGHDADFILSSLNKWSKYPVPQGVSKEIEETIARFGKLLISRDAIGLILKSDSRSILAEVSSNRRIANLLEGEVEGGFRVRDWARGQLKQELLKLGWPAEDNAGYTPGTPHEIKLKQDSWHLRDYQIQAVEKFDLGGSGVVVLPCGAGKTLVGAAAMASAGTNTLILVTNTVSARQWRDELLARTSLEQEDVAEYSGAHKNLAAVTIATYQILTTKRKGEFTHLELLNARDWGLVIYDEVHLLPAPIFKMTADLQARRRLGLTATLVREDGRESDVFSLIGPKRFDAPWKEIEAQGYIAPANCYEVRVSLPDEERMEYAIADQESRFRIAATSPQKLAIIKELLAKHKGEPTLIIGQYLDQIDTVSEALNIPKLTGATPVDEREALFNKFRSGELNTLVVSKVANFSIDLPEASVAIQISGAFGSRQEEAQRLGRLLRPKADGRSAAFYTVVARDTVEQDFAQNRQRFLAEQGYSYEILDSEDI
ncbi:DNA repair helicase XPB [Candidatus Aquiluna sp. UB-MaderosW2red]|uniref:DNA repair helicase XPB n=1 Tax=Candidatus Aquiluna sp. UB-MaderosW2red TaxID=1855377 RepID=UPI000875C173|nr:DNA repair helicase XPB [Candidatus Aquiluna sp. UB-MaderosW2red]SCX08487.1 DNA excision repair protein ERCC-3 [Candidatus Aquiluna sp. UB-MaderosW2red]